MSDQTKAVVFTEAGQPPQTPDEGQNPTQPEALTLEVVQRIAKEAEEAAFRRAQGLIDRGQKKVRERLTELEETWKLQADAGITIPDDVKDKMRQRVTTAVYSQPDTDPGSPPPAAPPPAQAPGTSQAGQALDPISAAGEYLMRQAGVMVEPNDPEAKTLEAANTAAEWLNMIPQAIAAKQARLAGTPPAQPAVPARMPTNAGGAGGGAANVNSLNARLVELQKYPSKNWSEIQEVTAELDKLIPKG